MNNYFEIALKEAKKALQKNEIPVGAVVVKENKIIAKSHNNRQFKHNVLGHAEINCIVKAEKKIKDWRLDDCEMFVTLKPCEMCQKIINESRIKKVYYLLEQKPKANEKSNYIQTNDCENEEKIAKKLLKSFFEKLRD